MKRQIEKYDAAIAAAAKAEGKAEAYQEIAAWNARRLEAEAKGIPFNEARPHKTERRRLHSERYMGFRGFHQPGPLTNNEQSHPNLRSINYAKISNISNRYSDELYRLYVL